MSFGMAVYNDGGNILIDGTYSNFHLTDKQTYTTDYNVGNTGMSAKSITFSNCNATLFAVRGPGITYRITTISGTTWTVEFLVAKAAGGSSLGTGFTVYRFDSNPPPSGDHYGMRIYNEAGALVFDSGYRTMRVVDLRVNVPTADSAVTYEGGHDYAAIPARSGDLIFQTGGGPTGFILVAFAVMGAAPIPNGIQTGAMSHSTFEYGPGETIPNYPTNLSSWLIVDVTGF